MKLGVLVKRPKRIFYGWWVVLAATVIGSLGGGFFAYGFTTFFLPISAELRLTRTATSTVFSAGRAGGALGSPLIGWLIDRHGSRKLMVVGLLMFAAGLILMYWMNSLLMFIIVYVGLIALGFQTGIGAPRFALANKWFIRQRSKATGVISAGWGLGGAVLVPVLGWLIINYGWRMAAVTAGFTVLIISLPLCLLIRNTPEDKGLLPDGEEVKEAAGKPSRAAGEVSFAVKEALKTPTFWILSFAFLLTGFVEAALSVHMVPLLVFKGLDEQSAANTFGLLLACIIPVRFGVGWLGDIYPKRYLLMLCSFIATVALIILLTGQSLWQLNLFVIIFALGYGGIFPLSVSIIGEYFGRKNFATIRGISILFWTIGGMTGPIFAGYTYDVTQSYQVAFIAGTVAYFLATLTFVFARPPKPPATVTGYTTSRPG